MKYFLATYEIIDGVHEHTGAVILEAQIDDQAYKLADAEEFMPETDNEKLYFSFGGDGMVACKSEGCTEITKEQMEFLERVGLAYRK